MAVGQPRTFRLEPVAQSVTTGNTASRRLAAAILGLGVPTLAVELHLRRSRPPLLARLMVGSHLIGR